MSWPAGLNRRTRTLLDHFVDELRVRSSPKTVSSRVSLLRFYLAWLQGKGLAVTEVRTRDLDRHRAELYAARKRDGKPYSQGALANRLLAIKSLYRYLYRRGFLLSDPAAPLELPKSEERLPRLILTKEEMKRLIAAPDLSTGEGLRDRALLETLYSTGLRVSELMNLKLGETDTEERVLRVVQGKGRRDRNVPLTRKACEALQAYLEKGRPQLIGFRAHSNLFLGACGGRLSGDSVTKILRRACERARIKKRVTCHTIRHTVATHLLKGGAGIRQIQAFLGHASLRTTERYTRVEISDLRQVIERAHPRGR